MNDITKIMIGNLINTLLAALNALDAPQDTKDALTENGDIEHVHWWITEGRGCTPIVPDDSPGLGLSVLPNAMMSDAPSGHASRDS